MVVRSIESSTVFVGPSICEWSAVEKTYVGWSRFAHRSGCGIPGRHSIMSVTTPEDRVMSLMTWPHVSIRTVRTDPGDVSRNGLVRLT